MELANDLRLSPSRGVHTFKLLKPESMYGIDIMWGWDARCWVYDDLISEFDTIEFRRDTDRWEYRGRMQDYQEELPYGKPCTAPLPD